LDIEKIINELKTERDRINHVIALLGGTQSPGRTSRKSAAGSVAVVKKTTNRLTPEGRKKLSDLMTKRWAERRRLKKSGR